ncbi:MAG: hypothetical protein LUE89_11645 [Clostridiales bacterium]|nr:hypothetical protein [Clostridiales bacterium]
MVGYEMAVLCGNLALYQVKAMAKKQMLSEVAQYKPCRRVFPQSRWAGTDDFFKNPAGIFPSKT